MERYYITLIGNLELKDYTGQFGLKASNVNVKEEIEVD